MTEEIKKKIEEEAKLHSKTTRYLSDFPHCERSEQNGFIKGANFMNSLLQEQNRWRKVEEELPEIGQTVWLKNENEDRPRFRYDIGRRYKYCESSGWYWADVYIKQEYTHWKPID